MRASDTPPPGTYNTSFDWSSSARGVPRLNSGGERFQEPQSESDVGPGEYRARPSIEVRRVNRKQPLSASGPRFRHHYGDPAIPGPGSYDTSLSYGNLLKPVKRPIPGLRIHMPHVVRHGNAATPLKNVFAKIRCHTNLRRPARLFVSVIMQTFNIAIAEQSSDIAY